ncbi:unnamed protein product [Urochloa humidicola]
MGREQRREGRPPAAVAEARAGEQTAARRSKKRSGACELDLLGGGRGGAPPGMGEDHDAEEGRRLHLHEPLRPLRMEELRARSHRPPCLRSAVPPPRAVLLDARRRRSSSSTPCFSSAPERSGRPAPRAPSSGLPTLVAPRSNASGVERGS